MQIKGTEFLIRTLAVHQALLHVTEWDSDMLGLSLMRIIIDKRLKGWNAKEHR